MAEQVSWKELREFMDRALAAQAAVDALQREFGAVQPQPASRVTEVFDQEAPAGPSSKTLFFVTFGTQYAYEDHPRWAPAHPDGVLAMRASSMISARLYAFHRLGPHWSMIMPPEEWAKTPAETFPRGVLALWSVPEFKIYAKENTSTSVVVWADDEADVNGPGQALRPLKASQLGSVLDEWPEGWELVAEE